MMEESSHDVMNCIIVFYYFLKKCRASILIFFNQGSLLGFLISKLSFLHIFMFLLMKIWDFDWHAFVFSQSNPYFWQCNHSGIVQGVIHYCVLRCWFPFWRCLNNLKFLLNWWTFLCTFLWLFVYILTNLGQFWKTFGGLLKLKAQSSNINLLLIVFCSCEVSGDDRVQFLHNQSTANFESLHEGEVNEA